MDKVYQDIILKHNTAPNICLMRQVKIENILFYNEYIEIKYKTSKLNIIGTLLVPKEELKGYRVVID